MSYGTPDSHRRSEPLPSSHLKVPCRGTQGQVPISRDRLIPITNEVAAPGIGAGFTELSCRTDRRLSPAAQPGQPPDQAQVSRHQPAVRAPAGP